MKCPYCAKDVWGMTGFQEAWAFNKHLPKCRKNPNSIILRDGKRTAISPIKHQNLMTALEIRAESGQ